MSTKPKRWDGGQKAKQQAKAKKSKTPKPLAEPVEPVPDEVEVIDEQTSLVPDE